MNKTRIKSSSNKRMPLYRQYQKVRHKYLEDHPICKVCNINSSTQIHHKKGRMGTLLIKTCHFLAVCMDCHDKITNSPQWARDRGFSLDRLKHD